MIFVSKQIDKLSPEAKNRLNQVTETLRQNRDLGTAKSEAKQQLQQSKPAVEQNKGQEAKEVSASQLQTPSSSPAHAIPSKEGHRAPAAGLNPNSRSSVTNPNTAPSYPKQANPLAAKPSLSQNQQGIQKQANPVAVKPSETQKGQQQPEKGKEQDRGRE